VGWTLALGSSATATAASIGLTRATDRVMDFIDELLEKPNDELDPVESPVPRGELSAGGSAAGA
jgi:hypothetical protein